MLCWFHFVDFLWVWILFICVCIILYWKWKRATFYVRCAMACVFVCVCVPIAYNVIYVSQSTHITFVRCVQSVKHVLQTSVCDVVVSYLPRLWVIWSKLMVIAHLNSYMNENTSIYESTCIWFVRSKQRVKPHNSVRSIRLIEMLLILHESEKDFFFSSHSMSNVCCGMHSNIHAWKLAAAKTNRTHTHTLTHTYPQHPPFIVVLLLI